MPYFLPAIQTSAQLAALLSDETGTAANVFANTPTLVTPALGAATATSINGNTLTTGTYTLTGTAGKTLTFSKSLTLDGTDSTTMTFPTTSATIARTDAANTFTGVQTMTSPALTTPVLGTPSSGTLTSCTGTADGLTAGDVTRNHAVYAGASPPTVDVGMFVISKTGVDLKNAATTTVFTVPASRTFVCISAWAVVTSITSAGAGTETFKIQASTGSVAMTQNVASASFTPAVGKVCTEQPTASAGPFGAAPAADNVQVVVATSHAGSTAVAGTVFVQGFYSA